MRKHARPSIKLAHRYGNANDVASPRRKLTWLSRLAVGFATSTLIPLGMATPALAGSLHLAVQPVRGVYLIQASGTFDIDPTELDVFVHHGAGGCPSQSAAENAQVENQIQTLGVDAAGEPIYYRFGTGFIMSGSYSQQAYWGVNAPHGPYSVCAYLLVSPSPTGQPADPPQATASAQLTIGPAPPPAQNALLRCKVATATATARVAIGSRSSQASVTDPRRSAAQALIPSKRPKQSETDYQQHIVGSAKAYWIYREQQFELIRKAGIGKGRGVTIEKLLEALAEKLAKKLVPVLAIPELIELGQHACEFIEKERGAESARATHDELLNDYYYYDWVRGTPDARRKGSNGHRINEITGTKLRYFKFIQQKIFIATLKGHGVLGLMPPLWAGPVRAPAPPHGGSH